MDEHKTARRMMDELRDIKKAMVQKGFQSLLLQGKNLPLGRRRLYEKTRIKKPVSKSAATLAEQGLLGQRATCVNLLKLNVKIITQSGSPCQSFIPGTRRGKTIRCQKEGINHVKYQDSEKSACDG